MIKTMDEAKKAAVVAALDATNGNRTHAAKALGICIRTMRNYVRKFGLERYLAQPSVLIALSRKRTQK